MDGFIFTFLPALFELGIGIGLPLTGVALAVPRLGAYLNQRRQVKAVQSRDSRRLADLERYVGVSYPVICQAIVETDGHASKELKNELTTLLQDNLIPLLANNKDKKT
jgi:hypothetical protein